MTSSRSERRNLAVMTQWGLDTLFNPAKRHMDEEKRRLQSTREEVGDSSGGKRIDLESGKVRIKPPAGDDDAVDDAVDEAAAEETKPAEKKPAAKKPTEKPAGKPAEKVAAKAAAKKELTPAQLRAAQRRGRAPR